MKTRGVVRVLIFLSLTLFSFYFFNKEREVYVKPPKTSGALEALQNWTLKRAYPNEDIPSSKYYAKAKYILFQNNLTGKTIKTYTRHRKTDLLLPLPAYV